MTEQLTLLDLFSGCGGMALGFQRAGFKVLGGLDMDERATTTFTHNLLHGSESLHGRARSITADIVDLDCHAFHRATFGTRQHHGKVDLIISGPPCQAFARIGRAKLREVMRHPRAHTKDHRAGLYLHLLTYIEFYAPKAVVIENVPDILRFEGRNVAEEIAVSLDEMGYRTKYTVLNAVHYGVPQLRSRVVIIGIRKNLHVEPIFPAPSHQYDLPMGYRAYARVPSGQLPLFPEIADHYVAPPSCSPDSPKAVTVHAALHDLPNLAVTLNGRAGKHPLSKSQLPYPRARRPSPFAKLMRGWPRLAYGSVVNNHTIRTLPRDRPIFRDMAPGDDFPSAKRLALRRFAAKLRYRASQNGRRLSRTSQAYELLFKATVPPYDETKFFDKWKKLVPDRPSHTLTAHLGKDGYSHIHYDSLQARVISVREAARLQSFPDGFLFPTSMAAAFTQIGNAVPPLLAYAVAKDIRRQLRIASRKA